MQRVRFSIFYLCLAFCLALGLMACRDATTMSPETTPGISTNITADVCPSSVIKVGDQIQWTNGDQAGHVVQAKASDGTTLFDSGTLGPADSFSFTFTTAGVYTYSCTPDGSLTGTITVES